MRPTITHFTSDGAVFDDGFYGEYDTIVLATGYEYKFPFLDDKVWVLSWLTTLIDTSQFSRSYINLVFPAINTCQRPRIDVEKISVSDIKYIFSSLFGSLCHAKISQKREVRIFNRSEAEEHCLLCNLNICYNYNVQTDIAQRLLTLIFWK